MPWRVGFKSLPMITAVFVGFLQGAYTPNAIEAQAGSATTKQIVWDTISIRPTQYPCQDSGLYRPQDGLHVVCIPLSILIQEAYGVHESSRILGMPSWAQAFYNVDAKVDGLDVAAYGRLSSQQRDLMFQLVLEDRFKLAAHRQTKELPAYALVIAKGGSKMTESKPREGDSSPAPLMGMKGRGRIESNGGSLSFLLRLLAQDVGRPVIDRTGLTGTYDFHLQWTPESVSSRPSAETSGGDTGPSIFTALEEQLGLRLEPITAPLDVLVIDHIDKPSEN